MFLMLDWKLCIANETCHTVVFYLLSIATHTVNIEMDLSFKHNHAYINIHHDEMHICTVASYIHTLEQH